MFIPELFGSPGPDAHQQVGTPEQDMEPVHVLGNATVCNFPIPEIPFDYEKGVLDLTANRRDTIFHLLFPVDSLINPLQREPSSHDTTDSPSSSDASPDLGFLYGFSWNWEQK